MAEGHVDDSRRSFLRLAVATGGAAGLSACLSLTEEEIPRGDPDARPERQHAWDDTIPVDEDGNPIPPAHHVLLALELKTEPDEALRETVEAAFRRLEEAYAYGPDGLLFTVGYTPAYFQRVSEESPIPAPAALANIEDPTLDTMDAVVHLASDHAHIVLEAEEALFGEADPNGLDPAPFDTVFERATPRRTGFVGPGLPAEYTDLDGVPDAIPEDAPFFVGFRSGFGESQAPESRVTIQDGPFTGGTTMHVESMTLNLRQWFHQDTHDQRVSKLFSPVHAEEGIGEIGEELGGTTGAFGVANDTEEHARTRGVVGHAQKTARARDPDGVPRLRRRDFNTVDGDRPGVHFVSHQRSIDDFVAVRDAMFGTELTGSGIGRRLNNGILQYIHVTRRGNFLIPVRAQRSLPGIGGTNDEE